MILSNSEKGRLLIDRDGRVAVAKFFGVTQVIACDIPDASSQAG